MNDLKGKRLLIMGGVRNACNIVKKAKELGIHVIVTDYLEDSPAKKITNESYMVSTTDVDAIVQLAKHIKVDAVFTSYIDSMLTYCQQVCEKLGFPFYATSEQIKIMTDKNKFKIVCRDYGLPVIKEYNLDADFRRKDLDKIEYPVVIKPVDAGGSKGVLITYNEDELVINYKKALTFSKSKQIVLEKYMTGDEVVMYYNIQDGYVSLSAMCDRYTNKKQKKVAQIPTAYIFPSRYLEALQREDDNNIRKMIRSLGIKNGVLFIQSFIDKGRVCIYEPGFRFAGAQGHKIINAVNGIDTLEMMIRYSLTGKMTGWDIKKNDNPNFKKWACKLTPIAKLGTIARISGLDEIVKYPEVFDIAPVHEEGDKITAIGTLDQLIARIFIVSEDKQTLIDVINNINRTIKVTNIEGEDMLLTPFDAKILTYY